MICHCTPYLDVSRLAGGWISVGSGSGRTTTQQVYFRTNVRNHHHPRFQRTFQMSNVPYGLDMDIAVGSVKRSHRPVIDKQVSKLIRKRKWSSPPSVGCLTRWLLCPSIISRWWFQTFFYFHPYLWRWSKLTNIFQRGWNHQLVFYTSILKLLACRNAVSEQKCDMLWL